MGESSAQFVYLSRRRFKLAQGDLQLSEGGVARGEGVAEAVAGGGSWLLAVLRVSFASTN